MPAFSFRLAPPSPSPPNPEPPASPMSSAGWRRFVGQRFNTSGVATVVSAASATPRLFLPHISVLDARWLDWAALRRAGFRGVVFDKDNTLTAPYAARLWPGLAGALRQCRAAFPPGAVAVFSNSAGLSEYDPDGMEARKLEAAIEGIHVIRHEIKKPAGSAKEIEEYFGCPASNLVMVGDRYFTDVLFGNRNGFLTVLTEPLNFAEESYIVRRVRKIEAYIISFWYKQGLKPINHPLLPDVRSCVKQDPWGEDSLPTLEC